MKSIRRYLQTVLLLVMVLVMGVAALISYFTSAHEIDEVFDARLAQYARLLANYEGQGMQGTVPVPLKHSDWIGHKYESKISFQIWQGDHTLLIASENALIEPLGPYQQGFHDNFQGKPLRVFVLEHSGRWYMTAERMEIRKELVGDIAFTSVMPAVLGTVLVMVLMGWTLSRGFLPLQQLADAITRRRADDLTALSMTSVPQEVQPLVDNLNGLLLKMQASLAREKRFSADAAHELKTPLAALKLRIANLQAVTAADERIAIDQIASCVGHIQRIVEQLLLLSRLEPQQVSQQVSRVFNPVQLLPLCRNVLAQEAVAALDKHQDIQLEGIDESLAVNGDETLLHLLLRNLVCNAVLYTPVDGQIVLRVLRSGDHAQIMVSDNGPGIPASEREQVFERFHRGSGDAHHSGTTGSGLGLAIAREIVRLHGGEISLQDVKGGQGLCVQVVLPAR